MQQNNRITTIRMMVNNATATGTTIIIRVHTGKEVEFGPTTKKLGKVLGKGKGKQKSDHIL